MASPTIGQYSLKEQASANITSTAVDTAASGSSFMLFFSTPSGATISAVSDSKGNTYSSVTSQVESNSGGKLWCYLCTNGTGGASHTASVTFSAEGATDITFIEILGGATASLVDVSNVAYDTSTPFACAVTTTQADDLVIAAALTYSGTPTYTANGGFTKILNGTGPNKVTGIAHRAAATATSYDPAWTVSAASNFALITVAVKAGVSGPTVTSVSTATPREGASLTITGTAFGASQGAGNSTINSISQTETSWADTQVVSTVVLGTNKFGAAYNVAVTDNAGTPSNNYAGITGLLPANADLDYVDVGTPNADPDLRLESTADAVSGDQVEWETKGGLVTVNPDLTFSAGPGVKSFRFRLWTSGSGYGDYATQTTGGRASNRMRLGFGSSL